MKTTITCSGEQVRQQRNGDVVVEIHHTEHGTVGAVIGWHPRGSAISVPSWLAGLVDYVMVKGTVWTTENPSYDSGGIEVFGSWHHRFVRLRLAEVSA